MHEIQSAWSKWKTHGFKIKTKHYFLFVHIKNYITHVIKPKRGSVV